MVKRSTPRKNLDDRVFPVRVRFENPCGAWDTLSWVNADCWLCEHIGAGDYARHPDGHTMVLHFRAPADALRFVDAFPQLPLTDRTWMCDHLKHNRAHAAAGGRPLEPAAYGSGWSDRDSDVS